VSALPDALVGVARDPSTAALFVDYDGTLAPIVADPDAARPLPGSFDALVVLGARYALVAVVSGRSVGFLRHALGHPPGVHLVGHYGLESADAGGDIAVLPSAEPWRDAVEAATTRVRAEAPPGVGVEPKGLSLALHWRTAPDQEAWVRGFAAEEAARSGLVPNEFRMAIELRPPVQMDKGVVIAQLAPGHRAAACFGDDVGDLPAFAELGRLAATGMIVARIAVVDDESPPQVAAAADVVVEGPLGALALLEALGAE
jgi:trehalose 6-phosphate phosphatase